MSFVAMLGVVALGLAQPSGGWDETQTIGSTSGLTDHGNGVIQLLDKVSGECSGAAVLETTEVYDPTSDGVFSKCYEVYFGCPGNDVILGPDSKGDGLAFSFYKGAYNVNNGLACGGGLGYMGANPQMITIEFDTWSSEGLEGFDSNYEGENIEDQIAVHKDGDAANTGKLFGVNPGNLEDGLEHTVCIEYDPASGVLTVDIDTIEVLNYTLDATYRLENYFGTGGLSQSWSSGKHGATNPATVTDGADITDNVGGPLCGNEVYITSPSGGSAFSSCDGPIEITADAIPPSGNEIDSMVFFVDGVRLARDEDAPYSTVWNNPRNGSYALTAAAYFSPSETQAFSSEVTVTFGGQIQLTSTAFVIDGIAEDHWGNYTAIPLNQAENGVTAPDLDASYKIAFDTDNLYVLVDVIDDDVSSDGGDYWDNDGVEIYIDMGNDKAGTYGADDYQYTFNFGAAPVINGTNNNNNGVVYNTATTASGYLLEVVFPWTTLGGGMPAQDDLIGFDIIVNDDDAGGSRDHRLAWNDGSFFAFSNPGLFGTQKFSECNPIKPQIIAVEDSFCNGDSIRLLASPQDETYDYEWIRNGLSLGSALQGDSVLWVKDSAEYQVAVDNGGGFDTSDIMKLIVIEIPKADAGVDTGYCANDGGVQLLAQGGESYVWSTLTGLSDSLSANPIAAPEFEIEYVVTVYNDFCYDRDTVSVEPYLVPEANAGEDLEICFEDSVSILASGGVTYEWNNSLYINRTDSAVVTVRPIETSSYVVRVGNGRCSDADTVEVIVHELPIAEAIDDQDVCHGDSARLGVTSGYSYAWFPEQGMNAVDMAAPKVLIADTTVFTVVVSNEYCSIEDSLIVHVMERPDAEAIEDTSFCQGEGGVALSASGGEEYTWSPANGLSSPQGAVVSADPLTTTEYVVTAAIGMCFDTDTVLVTVHETPQVAVTEDAEICEGDTVELIAEGGLAYEWSPALLLSNSNTSMTYAFPDTTTKYTVLVSNEHCTVSDSVTLTVLAAPTVIASDDTRLCAGSSTGLTVTTTGTILWTPSTDLDDATSANPVASPLSTTEYVVSATIGTCVSYDTVLLTVDPIPQLVLTEDASYCEGIGPIPLTASGADSYAWAPEEGLDDPRSANPIATIGETSSYSVTATTGNCAVARSVTIEIRERPVAYAGEDVAYCSNEAGVQLIATGGALAVWSPSSTLSEDTTYSPMATPVSTTDYIVTVSENGCHDTDTVRVEFYEAPIVNAGVDSTICAASNLIQLQASGAESYAWSPSEGLDDAFIADPTVEVTETSTFYVTGSTDHCSAIDSVHISVEECEVVIKIPDVITPNDDHKNDVLDIPGIENYEDHEVLIFNRWGNQLFASVDYTTNQWDGTHNGKDLPFGTYYYIIRVRDSEFQGKITLVR